MGPTLQSDGPMACQWLVSKLLKGRESGRVHV